MSILFVLLTFLLLMTITYFVKGGRDEAAGTMLAEAGAPQPTLERQYGFDVPKGYGFHPGHTWVVDEGRQNARVGMDALAANLFGKIDRIEIVGLNRWVRQGQKLMTISRNGLSVEMLSPVEGIVMAVNPKVLRSPSLAVEEPYKDGWIAVIKSPDLATNFRNLVQGTLVAPWMQNTLGQLSQMTARPGATAADGGTPIRGMLGHLEPEMQRRVIREFFLT